MNKVTLDKNELTKAIKKNRKNHRKLFEEAYDAFREKLIANLESRLKAAKKGGIVELHLDLVEPIDHTDEYDRALEMLKLEVNNTVTLSSGEFAQYVQDDWGWQGQFATMYVSNTGKNID